MGVGKRALAGVLAGNLLVAAGAVQAALSEPVDGMVYDDVLDLCWLQDANASGRADWADTVAWAEGLEVGGHTDWRLAQMSSSSSTDSITVCDGSNEEACRTSGNELGYNLYHNLGGPGTGDREPFTGIGRYYWSGTEDPPTNPGDPALSAWVLDASNGNHLSYGKRSVIRGWAVRDGQCRAAPVAPPEPIPAAGAWGLGVLGLLLMLLARARLR
jgi:hypothetical protein